MIEGDLRRVADPLVGRLVWIRFGADRPPMLAGIELPVSQGGRLTFVGVDPVTHQEQTPMFDFAAEQIVSIKAAGEA